MNSEPVKKVKNQVDKKANSKLDDIKWERLETQEELDEYYRSIEELMNSPEFKPVYTPSNSWGGN